MRRPWLRSPEAPGIPFRRCMERSGGFGVEEKGSCVKVSEQCTDSPALTLMEHQSQMLPQNRTYRHIVHARGGIQ